MNQTTVFGHVGSEPTVKQVNEKSSVTNFSLAVNANYTNAEGTKVERTAWFQVEIWNKPNIHNFIKKGDSILLTGEVRAEAYLNKEAAPEAVLKLKVDTITFTSPKGNNEGV